MIRGWQPFRNPDGASSELLACPCVDVSVRWSGHAGAAKGLAVLDTGADRSLIDLQTACFQLGIEPNYLLYRVDCDGEPWFVRSPELSIAESHWKLPEHLHLEACRTRRGPPWLDLVPPLCESPGPELMILGRDVMRALDWMLLVDHPRSRFALLTGSDPAAAQVREIAADEGVG